MTADIASQRKKTSAPNAMTLTLATLTLFFALLSMVFVNRLTRLHTHSLKQQSEASRDEDAANQDMQTALKAATVDREAAQQALDAEKTAAEQLRRQLSTTRKELEQAKADLVNANQTVNELKSKLPAVPTPSDEPPEAAPQQNDRFESGSESEADSPTEPDQPPADTPAPDNPQSSNEPTSTPAEETSTASPAE